MSYCPVPKRKAGFLWGSADSPVQCEFFHDVQCPFSTKHFRTMYDFLAAGPPEDCNFSITISLGVLFGHGNAFDITRGVVHVAKGDTMVLIKALKAVADNFTSFSGDATFEKSRKDIQIMIAECLGSISGESTEEFISACFGSNDSYSEAKVMFRNMILKGMYGTPSYAINGVPISKIQSSMSKDEVVAVFEEVASQEGSASFL